MAHTLLIRCQAPMQAWGVRSLLRVRDSGREPTKSGIIGLLCAALGRERGDPLEDLQALRMGVRVDQEGLLLPDFQTARNVINYAGREGGNVISTRFYLSDAIFLVGLESQELALLQILQQALQQPHWLLYLGRRAFPPSQPVWLPDGLRPGQDLLPALRTFPCLLDEHRYPQADRLRFVIEDPQGAGMQHDQPLSFLPHQHRPRAYTTHYFEKPDTILQEG